MDKKFLIMPALALCAAQAFGSTYYVAVDGNDAAAGSKEKPFASLKKANTVVAAGDTVWIRGGVYDMRDTSYCERARMSAGVLLTTSGESDDKRIHYFAYPGERPIFDGTNLPIGQALDKTTSSTDLEYTAGILIYASYLHLKGIEVRNVPMKHNSNSGVYVTRCKHVILEQMESHHNAGPGFFVNEGGRGLNGGGHLFLNCDAHDNYDPTGRQGDGENADGFGVHYQYDGDTTKFFGCRSWWNSDDAYDLINQEFPVVIENSYAMGSGYSDYGTKMPKNGNGSGFKLGESTFGGGHHIIRNSVAWKNETFGFYANYTGAGTQWISNTSFQNGQRAFNMASTTFDAEGRRTADVAVLTGDNAHVLKNNIAFPNLNSQVGVCWVKIDDSDAGHDENCAAGENNTWNLKLDLTEDDFMSIDDPSMTVTGEDLSKIPGILGPRNPDGSVPNVDFLKLKDGSRAIDKGEDVGAVFAGAAPDLGAYEFGLPSSSSVISSSSVADPGSSSSAAESSSSIGNTTSIVANFVGSAAHVGTAVVFDLQGRYLGALQAEQLRGGNVVDAVRTQFRTPGAYLVRIGHEIQKVNVK
ncbi:MULTISPECIES: right-handed parallel beta-helix repeat-containing protein [unclassified Fibrobacter]|uniref:right-handed parallel beta-helix repeat-containing protein n=1 Tax=unclassified Fibrobacter TaxID=2634177 RepID=UPI000D6DB2DB|nr:MULTISPECIES: right-handed parallel beta-helix repeat-containing protein [unclassified Fibrobacter]